MFLFLPLRYRFASHVASFCTFAPRVASCAARPQEESALHESVNHNIPSSVVFLTEKNTQKPD